MGFLIMNGCYDWEKEKDGKWVRTNYQKGLQPTKSLKKGLIFHKSNITFRCDCCRENKNKGTRYLGKDWEKICVDCAVEWVNNSEETLRELIGILNDSKLNLKENERKWNRERLLGAIEK